MDIKIIVATHRDYFMPKDEMYLPVMVGAISAKNNFGFQGDNEGDSISDKNPCFCELTAMYWAWKNLKCDYVGLAHYRRHFSFRRKGTKWESVLTQIQAESLLQSYDVVVPKPRNYWIESISSHYKHTHDIAHLEETRKVIQKVCPEYVEAYDKVLKGTKAHMFNMFIMKKELADDYCSWLFRILFELEKQIDVKDLDPFSARLYGRVSEILLDVWLKKNGIVYKEVPYVILGPCNFWRKVKNFLGAKLLGKKYTASA